MHRIPAARQKAVFLLIVLAISYLWCVVQNILYGPQLAQAGQASNVNTTMIVTGLLWLVGHGLHGAAVIALPLMYW